MILFVLFCCLLKVKLVLMFLYVTLHLWCGRVSRARWIYFFDNTEVVFHWTRMLVFVSLS